MLSIKLLGSPAMLLDGAPVRGFVSAKAAALAYYLAATGRPHAREALAGLLWPEVSDAQANKNLRDVLSNLRRLLGPYLDVTRQTVALPLDERVSVDSRRFEEHARSGDPASLHAALAAYAGDFLDGFSLADAPAFEEWALVERERLRQLALSSLQRAAEHAGHAGGYQEAIGYLTRLLALDPTREEAHRQLMLTLALAGQRGAALAQYATCRRVLDEELGIEPDEATEALYRRILDGTLVERQPAPLPLAPLAPIYQLPAALVTPIGRAAEIERLLALLRDPSCRLITITGHGGAGKTCLALHAARQIEDASRRGELFAQGIVFVGLAAVELTGDARQDERDVLPILAARVADALSFRFSGPEPPLSQLAGALREKDLLLMLDNCEHLPVAGFVVALLEQAPRLTILVTSRRRLNLSGEQIVELGGLPFPSDAGASAQAAERYEAVQLFRRTAQAASPRLTWTRTASAAAARICQLVAGLPLAIELAASLARVLPIEEIAREIAANLEFIQSTRRDLPERHQSLQAVFDHSWRLLRPAEQRALRQLAVFRGGFSREAAAQVAGASLRLLGELIDNSLVRQVAGQSLPAGRYELLELVQQYAAEKLAEADRHGGEQFATAERHARFFLDYLYARRAELRGSRQLEAADEIYREIENIRVAWRWAIEQGRVELIAPAAESLFFFDEMRSWFREGAETFAQAAARVADLGAGEPDRELRIVLGRLLTFQGWCTFQIGRQAEAQALLRQGLAILRPLAIADELVLPLNYLAALAYYSGDYAESEQIVGEALAVSQACGNRHGAAVGLTILGQIAVLVGRYEDARRYSEESLALERELGNRWGMAFPLISLGKTAQATGANHEALQFFQEGLAIRQSFGDTRGVALCLRYLGATVEGMGDYAEAGWFYREALALFQAIGNQTGIVVALAELGYNAQARREADLAASYFSKALRVAWSTRAIPRILEVLVGIAATLAERDPRRARDLGLLARDHPAATQESRDRAAALVARLASEQNGGELPWPGADLEVEQLEPIVLALLKEST